MRGGEIGSAFPATTQLELQTVNFLHLKNGFFVLWFFKEQTYEMNNGNVYHRPVQSPSS